MNTLIDTSMTEIVERGVEDVIIKDHLIQALHSGKPLRVKFGIDPTGPKIHLGRAIPLRKLKAFQDLGHQIVLIIGDFTATIGDPSDKLDKRPFLTKAQIEEHMRTYTSQIGKIIDMKKVELHYNSEWLTSLTFKEICVLAECFSLQQMASRRNFKDRIDKEEEVSMREMLYPLMQGYDSVMVHADVEIGGFDQLFNCKAGRVIQKQYGQPEQDILTLEMLEGTDGRKMSTSWGNVITIVDEPNDMFGKIMSLKDALILKYFWLCTDISQDDLDEYQKRLQEGANPRDIKTELGKKIVTLYHSAVLAEDAAHVFEKVFSQKQLPEEIAAYVLKQNPVLITDLLVEAQMTKSKAEARRLMTQGGVSIDGKLIQHAPDPFLFSGGEVVKVGKRKFIRVVT